MKKKRTYSEIIVILDKSGSMYGIRSDTIGGFNKFLEEQKNVVGSAKFTLVQFDTTYHFRYNGANLQSVAELDEKNYYPEGCTALLDAVGRGIIETEKRIIESAEKPNQVVFVIITDGYENSSKEFSKKQISNMIKEKQNIDKWDFVFLGANIDSFSEAGSYGIISGTSKALHFTDEERNNLTKNKEYFRRHCAINRRNIINIIIGRGE